MNKLTITFASAAMLLAGAAYADQATPTIGTGKGQPSTNASPMGQERATQNSAGGSRNGKFGQLQSGFVKENQPYGQWLQDNGWTGSSK
jgi:hypothetical protein